MGEGSAPIDERVAEAIRDGLRAEAAPVGRHLAEVRGLSTRAIRQLERIESHLGTERAERVEDLAVLVDLISAGWRSVDDRLARIEELLCLVSEQQGGDERLDIVGLPGAEHDALSAEVQRRADAA